MSVNVKHALGNHTDNYQLIKNPFCCNSKFQVRVSPDKDPRYNKSYGQKEHIYTATNESNGNKYLINPNDHKMSFTFGKAKEVEMISTDCVDYEIPPEVLNEKRKDGKKIHTQGLPLSFIQITTEEEGIEWYKKHYPKIPDDLLPIIARYNWGDPINKKMIKNEKKKITRKLQEKGLTILTKKDNNDNPFYVKFD